jgi:hypothetical protein
MDDPQNRLYPEDQARLEKVLHSGVNQTERKPFRIWRLLGFIWLVLGGLSAASYWIALQHGVI